MRIRRRRKYGNVPTAGFHSRKEKLRHDELMLMQKAGVIEGLKCQVKYDITTGKRNGDIVPVRYPKSKRKAQIIIDFEYYEVRPDGRRILVYEDVKGYDTPMGRLKRGFFETANECEIKIT